VPRKLYSHLDCDKIEPALQREPEEDSE
jgi:hypothetical protein